MSEEQAAEEQAAEEHASGEPEGHDAHADEALGPIDWPAWGAAALGVAIAGFMALLMAFVVGIL
jgi:hypothetical protein